VTPAEVAARCADERAWWTRWADDNPRQARIAERLADGAGYVPRHEDPTVRLRCSDVEALLADARLLATVVAQSVADLEHDEAAVMGRHLDTPMPDGQTTLDLNDQLLTEAKALAARRRMSLTRLIEEGLQLRLRAESDAARRPRVRLPVFKGRGGLIAGVDPLSNRSLLEAADDDA
jgi:hypothetical protein